MADVDLDAVVAEARREALEMVSVMAAALQRALDAMEAEITSDPEVGGSPVDWPLPDELVLERVQLKAFVNVMETMPDDVRKRIRDAYAVAITNAKAQRGPLTTFELRTAPVLPETMAAYEELQETMVQVKRSAMFDRELSDALRPITPGLSGVT